MYFALLGALTVVDDAGDQVAVPGALQRALLASLLVRANTPVPTDVLIDGVWDGRRQAGSRTMVRSLVLRLRHALGPGPASRVVTQSPGYLVRVGESELDVSRFEALCRDARAAVRTGAWAEAARASAGALELWRGEPLLDVPSRVLHDQIAPRFGQLRLQVLEDGIEAGLRLGRPERLVPQLRDLTAAHPLRERLHAQLMTALARSGRRAEALEVYRDARRVLVQQLGVEPGPELRELQDRILADETGETEPPASVSVHVSAPVSVPSPAAPAPRQLPAAPRHFTGRRRELDVLTGLLVQTGGTVVISAIDGTAGIGKTALAVYWAHEVAGRFPDGQLYVDLRGYDASSVPVEPADAVRRFLDALGISAQRIPSELDERAALYRSQLADRRVLVLLDNARDVGQVRPLLPGSPGCLVLVTSRNQLGGLVALDGAVPLTLDLLTAGEARDLLIRRLGHERLAADEQAVDALVEACVRLPLALNIAAAHAAMRPMQRLSVFVDELRDARRRLDVLATGDDAADVRAVFSWSYRTLGADAARVFRLIGVSPGPDISLTAVATLAALDSDRTRRALSELTRARLLTEHAPQRYAAHDLLRAYAAERALAEDDERDRHDALRRVCDFYAHTAHGAERLLDPNRQPARFDPPAADVHPLALSDDPAAMAWFNAEHANLLAAQRLAAAHEWHATVWQLAWALTTFHARQGLLQDDLAVWQAAAAATDHLPDAAVRTFAHRHLGAAYGDLGRHEDAIRHLHQALHFAGSGDPVQQGDTHYMLSRTWSQHGDDRQALHHAYSALRIFRGLGRPVWEADALNAVGWYAARLGDYDSARTNCQAAAALYLRHHNPTGEAATLDSLGFIEHETGRHEQAIDYYQRALALYRGLGHTYQSANTLEHLGHPHVALAQRRQARDAWRQALDLYRQQDRTREAERVEQYIGALAP